MSQSHLENSVTLDVTLQALEVPAGWLIGPRSFLVDRISPDLERVWLMETSTGGGALRLRQGQHKFTPPPQGLRTRLRSSRSEVISSPQGWLLDLRVANPDNWAHFLNIHLALLGLVCRACDLSWREATIILPEATPDYIRAIASLCDLQCVFTDLEVLGQGVQFEISDWNILRGERHAILTDSELSPVAATLQGKLMPAPKTPLPRKVFLSRRGTRALSNEAEIEALLVAQGFVKFYPETLNVADQLRLLCQAEQVVAVHGAALAPLFYREANVSPLSLVELFPVGHITNVYRAAAAAVGACWCGVRGRLEAAHLSDIYRLEQPYLKHSLRNFQVDPASIEAALEQVSESR